MSTGMTVVLERVPPGDNWKMPDDIVVYPSLTEALNAIFEKTKITEFYIEARKGIVSVQSDVGEVRVVKDKKFNIYGDG